MDRRIAGLRLEAQRNDWTGNRMSVEYSMSVIWLYENGTGGEVAGLYFYGYSRESHPQIDVNSLKKLWTSLKGEIQIFIHSIPEPDSYESVESGSTIRCHVKLDSWPNDREWRIAVEQTLRTIASSEGSVAWCGGIFCDCQPDGLNPVSGGGIYAGFAEGVGFLCESPNASDEYKELSYEDMLALYRVLCSR